ncbi:hypothetical protein [Staphylococcus nepalensis]|uniref:hypothetical protein n=1 Tax=Staphylococcus nepalensis TaxID=214473 RepID=UPI003EE6AAEE
MINSEEFYNQVVPDINNIKGYKITYIYWALPTLNTKNMESWFSEITDKFSKANGTIQIIAPLDNKEQTACKNLDYWKLPKKYSHFEKEYKEKIDTYLKYFGCEFESHKNWYIKTLKNHNDMKFILTPLIEIYKNHISLFFININIYSNGVMRIELVEDLENLEFKDDLYSFKYNMMEDKLYPRLFSSKKRKYQLSDILQSKQLNDLIKHIKFQTQKISGKRKLTEDHSFQVFYLTNLEEINKSKDLYKEISIEDIFINAPIMNWDNNKNLAHLLAHRYKNEYIEYINRASIYIVKPSRHMENGNIQVVSKIASYFFSTADYHFQKTFIDELQLSGITNLNISGEKDILNFKNWLLRYKRVLMSVYRPNQLSSFDLYNNLEKNSYFKLPKDLEEITQDEMNIIHLENDYKKDLQEQKMNVTLLIISLLTIFSVLNIFFHNKLTILFLGIFLEGLLIYYTFNTKKPITFFSKIILSILFMLLIYL